METLARALKALSDPTRLRILKLVAIRELCVCEITEIMGVTSSCVSQHLAKLKAAGLVQERRDAQWVFHSADTRAIRALADLVGTISDGRIADVDGMDGEMAKLEALGVDPCSRERLCKRINEKAKE